MLTHIVSEVPCLNIANQKYMMLRRGVTSIYSIVCQHNLRMTRSLSTKTGKLDLRGVYPPITTPFNTDETIAFDKLEENLKRWKTIPFKGYVIMGSNGEYVYLSPEERLEILRRVSKFTSNDNKIIIAGSGCESTQATIDLTAKMTAAGAHCALVVTPCFYKGAMSNSALLTHYKKVADHSSIPIILYSVPANTGLDLTPEVIIQLADHPNIIGVKDSGGDISKLGNIIFATKNADFQVLAGSASFLYPALMIGCVGGVCALANVLGEQVCELQRLYEEGSYQSARTLQQQLIAPNAAVTRKYGVPGLKVAMEWFGYYGGPPRLPLVPLTEEQITRMKKDFISRGFL